MILHWIPDPDSAFRKVVWKITCIPLVPQTEKPLGKCNSPPQLPLANASPPSLSIIHGLFQRHESLAPSHTLYIQFSRWNFLHRDSCHRGRECAQRWSHYCVRYFSTRFFAGTVCLHLILVLLLTTTWCWTLPFFVRDCPFHEVEVLNELNIAAGFPYQRMLNYWSKGRPSLAKANLLIHLDFASEPFRTPCNALDSILFWKHPSGPQIQG